MNVLSWSGGADSTASIILDHRLHADDDAEKINLIVFAEVMFDKDYFDTDLGVSAETPEQLRFILKAKEVFEGWGYPVHIVRHESRDYMWEFEHLIERSVNTQGYHYGFPIAKKCSVQRDLKIRAVENFLKGLARTYDIRSCLGYTADETKRLEGMRKRNEKHEGFPCYSLLAENGISHEQAIEICEKVGLLSPIYKYIDPSTPDRKIRSGCWCCPWAKVSEMARFKMETCYGAEVFQKFIELEKRKDLAYSRWNSTTGETLKERNEKVIQFIDDYL